MFQPYPHAAGTIFRIMRKPFPLPAETYSAVCGKRSRCLRKPIPQYAGSVPARCGYFARTLRLPQCAETVSAGCGAFPAACGNCFRRLRVQFPQCADPAECTSWPPYIVGSSASVGHCPSLNSALCRTDHVRCVSDTVRTNSALLRTLTEPCRTNPAYVGHHPNPVGRCMNGVGPSRNPAYSYSDQHTSAMCRHCGASLREWKGTYKT